MPPVEGIKIEVWQGHQGKTKEATDFYSIALRCMKIVRKSLGQQNDDEAFISQFEALSFNRFGVPKIEKYALVNKGSLFRKLIDSHEKFWKIPFEKLLHSHICSSTEEYAKYRNDLDVFLREGVVGQYAYQFVKVANECIVEKFDQAIDINQINLKSFVEELAIGSVALAAAGHPGPYHRLNECINEVLELQSAPEFPYDALKGMQDELTKHFDQGEGAGFLKKALDQRLQNLSSTIAEPLIQEKVYEIRKLLNLFLIECGNAMKATLFSIVHIFTTQPDIQTKLRAALVERLADKDELDLVSLIEMLQPEFNKLIRLAYAIQPLYFPNEIEAKEEVTVRLTDSRIKPIESRLYYFDKGEKVSPAYFSAKEAMRCLRDKNREEFIPEATRAKDGSFDLNLVTAFTIKSSYIYLLFLLGYELRIVTSSLELRPNEFNQNRIIQVSKVGTIVEDLLALQYKFGKVKP